MLVNKTSLDRLNYVLNYVGAPTLYEGRQDYLAKLLDISSRSVRRWYAQETIPHHRIASVSEKLNITESWLADGTGRQRRLPDDISLTKDQSIVPFLQWSEIDEWLQNFFYFNCPRDDYKIIELKEMSEHAFVVQTTSLDMHPFIQPGSFVYIDPESTPESDRLVLVKKYDGLIPLVRYYIKKNDELVLLEAVAPGATTTKLTALDKILGVVKKIEPEN